MAASKELLRFTREALVAGKSRDEIATALGAAGWSASEISEALRAWSEAPFTPPIPRPQSTVSARDFFVYVLMFGVMLSGAFSLIQLFFTLIDFWFDTSTYYVFRIRWALSMLIVTVPVFLWLEVRERRALALDRALYRSAIRKWLIYIALLIAAVTLLGDLVSVIYALLGGELTVQFLLKALVVAVIAGGIFTYYLQDVRRGDMI